MHSRPKLNSTILLFVLFIAIWVAKTSVFFAAIDTRGVFVVKLLWPLLLASFIFISKKRLWTITLQVIYDILLVVCLTYWNANKMLPDINIAVDSCGQWSTFISSITSYLDLRLLIYPALTLVYLGCYLLIQRIPYSYYSKKVFLWCVGIFVIGQFNYIGYRRWKCEYYKSPLKVYIDQYIEYNHPYGQRFGYKGWRYLIPGGQIGYGTSDEMLCYADLLGYELSCTCDFIWNCLSSENVDITEETIKPFLSASPTLDKAKDDLIIILVESLESWVLDYKDLDGNYAMPNLRNWINEGPSLSVMNVRPQIRHGVSGDGQMIVLTGLLPTQHNAACQKYFSNVFPAISKCYDDTKIVAPGPAWNQENMNVSYGIKESYWGESSSMWHDERIIEVTDSLLNETTVAERPPFFLLTLTYSTHTPFDKADRGTLRLDERMDKNHQNYLQCINYLDQSLAPFFEKYTNSTSLQQATIIITGDHTIFRSDSTYCPLLIKSPHITDRIQRESASQMDIYPTIMNLLGLQNRLWQGFGINLLDDNATNLIEEETAFLLSDKMIRVNYFKDMNP